MTGLAVTRPAPAIPTTNLISMSLIDCCCSVITAGALWTPLIAVDKFDENILQLVNQIQIAVGMTAAVDVSSSIEDEIHGEQDAQDMFSLDEMREELERLRADSKKSGVHVTTADGEACALPGAIPETQDGLVVSDSMHTLVDTVISVTSKRRCGFWGSGGIGKTTTSAWLCRQDSKFTSNPPLPVISRPCLTG